MFIVSKDGLSVREPKHISMWMEYSEETKEEAQRIGNRVMYGDHFYKYRGPQNTTDDLAKRRVDEYLKGKAICSIALDREFVFGTYDEAQGKIVFEKILAALKNGERFFDMREVESGEDSQCD